MIAMFMSILIALALGASPAQAGTLTFTKPAAWKERAPVSSMRVAEFVVPKAPGDSEDAEVIVYYFGGGGGSVEANLQRWTSQFQSTTDPVRTAATVNGLKLTSLDVERERTLPTCAPARASTTTNRASACVPLSSRRRRVRTPQADGPGKNGRPGGRPVRSVSQEPRVQMMGAEIYR